MIFYGGKPAGTQHRNHCPNCLTSLHLDNEPGDRAAAVSYTHLTLPTIA